MVYGAFSFKAVMKRCSNVVLRCDVLQVNTQLFSAREKKQMSELIDTMIGYNLTYHQERNFEGQYTYILDP